MKSYYNYGATLAFGILFGMGSYLFGYRIGDFMDDSTAFIGIVSIIFSFFGLFGLIIFGYKNKEVN